ncbi:MAG: SDR family oxidoreductase [Gammaproteobacteria bacterium]|nr:SDR family oxidoreductase [Gammaproteobacteria bacterium]
MPVFLENKPVALVIGASRGIGADVAEVLAQAGAHVILVGRSASPLQSIVCSLTQQGCACEYYVCDVTHYEQVEKFIDTLDRVDILINNAGTALIKQFTAYTEDEFDQLFDLNVKAYFFTSQFVAKKMIQNKSQTGGVIINISSIMGKVAQPIKTPRPQVLYTVSKHAIEGLTKALSVELAPYNIRVNSVCPTYVATSLTKELLENENTRDFMTSRIPLGKFAEKRDVSQAVLFLCSSMASMITGDSVMIDGGWTAV